ncbi:WD repeat-containing 76-like [Paramuricea clavata]|uniref:WD repeat-containing protein 76 n=1 Tax=Paramuricea clavata TaxID=317549 RepID=A0A6S7HD54_PARCT|nr:WD repeat-containing 76-like [Paramuricea clavata]
MCFHPTRNDLMSCGADGTFKRADFNTCVFDEIYASNDRGINSFSYPYNSRETFLLAFTDGHMTVLDTRESKSKNTSHLCHTKAIKCIDCHPANEYLFCTSSADATVAIWDLRRIKGMKSKLGTFQGHNRSVTSAYFSPLDGKYVLSTSWDDTVKVLEQTSSSKLEVKRNFRHFNQTNRWLSAFKATWDPRNGRGFVIGSMLANRRIQFYHVEQRTKAPLLEMFNENFTTIASTNVFHPSKNIIASGNSSGKVFVWSE